MRGCQPTERLPLLQDFFVRMFTSLARVFGGVLTQSQKAVQSSFEGNSLKRHLPLSLTTVIQIP